MLQCLPLFPFWTPELLTLSDEKLDAFYAAQPDLKVYQRYINDIRRKKAHILSNEEEKILAAANDLAQAPDSIFSLVK